MAATGDGRSAHRPQSAAAGSKPLAGGVDGANVVLLLQTPAA